MKRRTYKRKTYNKKPTKNIKRYIKKKFDDMVEDKYINNLDLFIPDQVGSAVNLQNLITINQGTAVNQRINDRLRVKKINIKFVVEAGEVSSCVRILVFQWKGFTPPIAGLNILQTFGIPNVVNSPYRWEDLQSKLINVLYDRRFKVSTVQGDAMQLGSISLSSRFVKNIQYETGTNIALNNNLYFYSVSDTPAAIATQPTVSMYAQTIFEDA